MASLVSIIYDLKNQLTELLHRGLQGTQVLQLEVQGLEFKWEQLAALNSDFRLLDLLQTIPA